MRKDPYRFRHDVLRDARSRAVLAKAAEEGGWGRPMPAGTAQGIAFHTGYEYVSAVLVEIDCRPETVNRPIRDGVTGPRVTKAVFAVDVGLAVNPRGLEAQMMGCAMDGMALALTSSLHLRDGYFLESELGQLLLHPAVEHPARPPGHRHAEHLRAAGRVRGELGVAASMAAVAGAYGRATGTMPTSFPINHGTLSFEPKPTVPPSPSPRPTAWTTSAGSRENRCQSTLFASTASRSR